MYERRTNLLGIKKSRYKDLKLKLGNNIKFGKIYSIFTISRPLFKAFTLAEVLITLGLIGIVAAITIPNLMNKTNDNEFKTAYKKAYSAAAQAWGQAISNNELVDLPNASNQAQRLANFAAFQSKFKVMKTCGDASTSTLGTTSDCWKTNELWWGAYPDASGVSFIDNSGMSWALTVSGVATQDNGVLVDTNGFDGPNKFGQDRFIILIVANDGSGFGALAKTTPYVTDCLDTTAANCGGKTYTNVCPSVTGHPCYYKSWLMGAP